ncbi:DUF305 domain-containing protein [Mycobacterium sp. CBMA 234]|uniref:DUF305 domain-containing protein n=1 Tax=Mycolicibacterium sp. CBMA 234 TaxID=1918495 RepID=UPI001EE3C10F|nr:DUF305 domain-containing protein [Mycolicibacterium sp. CBMA 234]MUL64121.1 DUF305 domain-containing protein [Mycolicibacterium sp. CBMA 234]
MFKIAPLAIAGTAAAAAIALAACSPPNEHASTMPATSSPMSGHNMPGMSGTSTAPAANFNDADVMFLDMMYPHHAQAVEMAKLVPARTLNQQVKDLAAAIEKAQAPEMQQMTTLLAGFGKPAPSATMSHSMPGLMTPQQMTELTGLTGAPFDKMWLQMMVEHHQGAITMANDELKNGTNPDAKGMAQAIVTAQQAEIATMNGMLAKM